MRRWWTAKWVIGDEREVGGKVLVENGADGEGGNG
jgi:hypothetical protein